MVKAPTTIKAHEMNAVAITVAEMGDINAKTPAMKLRKPDAKIQPHSEAICVSNAASSTDKPKPARPSSGVPSVGDDDMVLNESKLCGCDQNASATNDSETLDAERIFTRTCRRKI
jgi:hypothetical protein